MNILRDQEFFTKKNIIIGVIILVLVIAIPVTVKLAQIQTQIKSQAAVGDERVSFTVGGAACPATGTGDCTITTTTSNINVILTAPWPTESTL